MSENTEHFHDVAAVEDVATHAMTPIEIGETKLVLVRQGEEIRAFSGLCPHKGAPMADGAVCDAGDEQWLVCPWHKAAFDACSGAVRAPLALTGLTRYTTRVIDGRVLVALDAEPQTVMAGLHAERSVLILGAGAAGVAAAAALREYGHAGAIALLSEEACQPYDRTALSKMVVAQEDVSAAAPPLLPKGFYLEHKIERVRGHVVGFDPQTRTATLQSGETLTADDVIIATGARAKPLDIPGCDLDGVLTLRSQEDARAIIRRTNPRSSIVIVGAGFIGLEVASALRKRGAGVAVIGRDTYPLERQFGREIGQRLRALHIEKGVAYVGGHRVTKIVGEGQVHGVVLDDGTELRADMVIAGIGALPNTQGFEALDLTENGGIAVDHSMACAEHVYAVGDLASMTHDGAPVRIEHFRTAQAQARIAARAILGLSPEALPTPWFWTQQHGKKLEYLGWPTEHDVIDIEGSVADFDFLAILRRQGRVVGVLGAGRAGEMAQAAVDFEGFAQARAE